MDHDPAGPEALNEVRCFPDVVWNGLLGIQDHTERFRHWKIARARIIVERAAAAQALALLGRGGSAGAVCDLCPTNAQQPLRVWAVCGPGIARTAKSQS